MSTRNNTNTGKETTSAQEEDHGDFQTLIERAITWKLMAKNDNCAVVLPNKLLRLATLAKESGRSKTAVNDTLDKIILIAQILQEWSWKDKSDEWRKELMEHMEEELTTRTNNIHITIDGIGREARTTWKKLEEMTEKMTEVSTKIATIGNTIPDRDAQTGREEGEIKSGPPKSSYANAARNNASPTHEIQHHQHNTAVKEAEIKDRRIVITSQTPSDWTLGERELVAKANIAMERIVMEEGAETVKPEILAATKIANKGAFLLLRSAEEVRWVKEEGRMERFAAAWGSTASLRPNYAEVVVEAIPVETPINSPTEQRRIEVASGIRTGAIKSIRWIKQIEKRKEVQRHAHAIFSMDTRNDANELLTERVIIQGRVLRAKKNNPDPRRCVKCNTFGHIAEQCKSEKDVCARCAGRHRTATCQATEQQLYCANCKKGGHGAASRECPEFQKALKDRMKWDPERAYRLFITRNPNTWGRMDEPTREDFDQGWRTNVRSEYGEWTTVQRNKGKGRLVGGAPGEGGGEERTQQQQQREMREKSITPSEPTSNRGRSRGPKRAKTKEPGQKTLEQYRFSSGSRPLRTQSPNPQQTQQTIQYPTQMYPPMQMMTYQAGSPSPTPQFMSQPAIMLPPQHMTPQYLHPPPPSQPLYSPAVTITPATPRRWGDEPMMNENERRIQQPNEGWI